MNYNICVCIILGERLMFEYKKMAILGGTFDPIHFGHLLVAEQVYNDFQMEQIVFMPVGEPPHKRRANISDFRHRLKMLEMAVKENDHFSISKYEIEKKSLSYTVDTFRYLS